MAQQPDLGVWKEWKSIINMSPGDIMAFNIPNSNTICEMIVNGDSFEKAKYAWRPTMWELAREQITAFKKSGSVRGHDSSRGLAPNNEKIGRASCRERV